MFVLSLFFSLNARENPFFNVNEINMPLTSNQNFSKEPLKRASLSFPSTARIIESVTVKYKNLDGSIQTKKLILDKKIDWHLPVFISQTFTPLEENIVSSKKILQKKAKYKKLFSLPFISFFQNKKSLKVVTNASMIRNFLLVHPHRIVFDIREDVDIRSVNKKLLNNKNFTKIRIGNHKAYYRVVVELDGYYSYTLHKNKNIYFFNLK
jgi:hypothetical protein